MIAFVESAELRVKVKVKVKENKQLEKADVLPET